MDDLEVAADHCRFFRNRRGWCPLLAGRSTNGANLVVLHLLPRRRGCGRDLQKKTQNRDTGHANQCDSRPGGANPQSGRGGIRTFAKNPGKYAIHLKTGTESGTVGTENGPIDAILSELITLWPQLAASVREAVLQQATQSLTRGP